jgi:adenosine deaminase/adenosine deaminase CECR1
MNAKMPQSVEAILFRNPVNAIKTYICEMKWLTIIYTGVYLSLSAQGIAQPSDSEHRVNTLLESMREDVSALRQFFYHMPKGGDLHHHFSGSIYAETLLERALTLNYWVNRQSLEIKNPGFVPDKKSQSQWTRFSSLQREGQLEDFSKRLLRHWSVFEYNSAQASNAPHDHFFSTFLGFDPLLDDCLAIGILEIKQRAIKENISYIETIYNPIPHNIQPETRWDEQFRQSRTDSAALYQLMGMLFMEIIRKPEFKQSVDAHNAQLRRLHDSLQVDDAQFAMRYQNFVLRVKSPKEVFTDMALCFASANGEALIVGVNIVAPEDHPVAMKDYALHMEFFRFFRNQYPAVKCALHAGELALGLVKPEDISGHIETAVEIAGANRIGHGVGIPYERLDLLEIMADKGIPVEINLSSNAFILGVTPEAHPVSIYRRANVPVVLSSDDAGVLRHHLSEEYVLLYRHQPIDYPAIKEIAFNALRYSFIEEPELLQRLQKKLHTDFAAFEQKILSLYDR